MLNSGSDWIYPPQFSVAASQAAGPGSIPRTDKVLCLCNVWYYFSSAGDSDGSYSGVNGETKELAIHSTGYSLLSPLYKVNFQNYFSFF